VTSDDDSNARLLDAANGQLKQTFKGHSDRVFEAVFAPDGKLIATASADATARLWNAATGEQRAVLRGHAGPVRGVAFSSDGHLATASDDRRLRLWEVQTAKLIQTLPGHWQGVQAVAFSPDGKRLASGSADRTIRIWDPETRRGLRDLDGAGFITFSADGRMLGRQTGLPWVIRCSDLDNPDKELRLAGHVGEGARTVRSADGRYFATLGFRDQTARLWDAATGKVLLVIRDRHEKEQLGLAVDPTGRFLATGGQGGTVRIWDATPAVDGKERSDPVAELRDTHTEGQIIHALAFSPDGQILASAGARGRIDLWDPHNRKLLRKCQGHERPVLGIAFHPKGHELASASFDQTVRIWNVHSGRQLRILPMGMPAYPVAYSPDGERLAAGSGDFERGILTVREKTPGEVKIWDPRTGEELFLDPHLPHVALDLNFSPDGQRLAVGCQGRTWGEKNVRIYESTPASAAAQTSHWSVIYRDALRRPEIGPAWHVVSGRWAIEDGAFRGVPGADHVADIELRAQELPDEVEIRYDVWTPHQLVSECKLLDKAGRRGVRASVEHAPDGTASKGVNFFVETDASWPRLGGASGVACRTGQRYRVRLLRRAKWLWLWIDDREVAMVVAPDWPASLLRLHGHMANPGDVVYFANLEIRAPAEAVRRRQLRSWVEDTWNKTLLREACVEQLRARNDLTPAEVKQCRDWVAGLHEDCRSLVDASWERVRQPAASGDPYALALRQAEKARRDDPDDWRTQQVLGFAQLRAGEFAKAIVSLEEALKLHRIKVGSAHPFQHAAMAMAFHHMGKAQTAREQALRLRDLLRTTYWQKTKGLAELDTEVQALLGSPKSESPDVENIKDIVVRTYQGGWLEHQLSIYLAGFTADARMRTGRGERPGAADILFNRRQIEEVHRVRFQGPPAPSTTGFSYEDMQVAIEKDDADLHFRAVLHFERGYDAYGIHHRLRRTPDGWRIREDNSWILEEKWDGRRTVYGDPTWKKLDAEATRQATSSDRGPWFSTMAQGRRLGEIYQQARKLTELAGARALDWVNRGRLALDMGEVRDALQSFDKALSMDADVELPDYMNHEVRTLTGHAGPVYGVDYRFDGAQIVTSGDDRTLKILDARTGQLLQTLQGHGDRVSGVAFSRDGRQIAPGSADKTVRLWDAATGQPIQVLTGHTDEIKRLAFSRDGRRVVSAGADMLAKIWDVETGKELRTLIGHLNQVLGAVFSPDGQRIASASHDGTVGIWDANTGKELMRLPGHPRGLLRVAFSSDGQRLAAATGGGTVKVWDAVTGKALYGRTADKNLVESVCFSPDGLRLASASQGGTIIVWDAATGRRVLTLRGHHGRIFTVVFSPDSKRLASCAEDGTAKVWDVAARDLLPDSGNAK
jgi:WD40 repeat protein